jgi:lipopolysaccharide transport system ATP-binding protein
LKLSSTPYDAVNYYQNAHQTNSSFLHEGELEDAPGNEFIRILKFDVYPLRGDNITISTGVEFELQFYNHKSNSNIGVTFELKSAEEIIVFHHGTYISEENASRKGFYIIKGILPPHFLNAGNFIFNLIFGENQRYLLFQINDLIHFEIFNETLGSNSNIRPGITSPQIEYSISLTE